MLHAISRHLAKRYLRRVRGLERHLGKNMAIFLDDFIGEKILLDGCFDIEELECIQKNIFPKLRKNSVCLDIGANIGNHARFFSNHFTTVYAFEPHPRIFHLLSANSFGTNIKALHCGLSDKKDFLPIFEDKGNLGASRIVKDSVQSEITYSVQRLDDLVGQVVVGDIGFIKIDVEGHEAQVIHGAEETLRRFKPIVSFEVLGSTSPKQEPEAITALRQAGYLHFYQLDSIALWKKFDNKILRNTCRAISRALGPSVFDRLELRPVTRTNYNASYAVIVASTTPLQ